jgi:hypothetical protein
MVPAWRFVRALDLGNALIEPFSEPTAFIYFHIENKKCRRTLLLSGTFNN